MTPRRQLSEFLCREMLYDFATDSLDETRKKAVEESLHEYPELEDELRAVKNGIKYVRAFSKTEVSRPLLDAIQFEGGTINKIKNIEMWPRWIKWSAEAVIVAALVIGAVRLIPDDYWYAATDYWTLADVQTSKNPGELIVKDAPPEEGEAQQLKEEETGGAESIEETSGGADVAKADAEKPSETGEETAAAPAETTEDKPAKVAAENGFVYRMYMFSNKVDQITPLIVNKIREHGGEKAGEVRLGWRKEQGSYFHFTLPEKSYSDVTSFVSQFGDLRISKDPHRRIMPEGTNRFILWIEEISPQNKESDDGTAKSE